MKQLKMSRTMESGTILELSTIPSRPEWLFLVVIPKDINRPFTWLGGNAEQILDPQSWACDSKECVWIPVRNLRTKGDMYWSLEASLLIVDMLKKI
jgi:hypothetical protein